MVDHFPFAHSFRSRSIAISMSASSSVSSRTFSSSRSWRLNLASAYWAIVIGFLLQHRQRRCAFMSHASMLHQEALKFFGCLNASVHQRLLGLQLLNPSVIVHHRQALLFFPCPRFAKQEIPARIDPAVRTSADIPCGGKPNPCSGGGVCVSQYGLHAHTAPASRRRYGPGGWLSSSSRGALVWVFVCLQLFAYVTDSGAGVLHVRFEECHDAVEISVTEGACLIDAVLQIPPGFQVDPLRLACADVPQLALVRQVGNIIRQTSVIHDLERQLKLSRWLRGTAVQFVPEDLLKRLNDAVCLKPFREVQILRKEIDCHLMRADIWPLMLQESGHSLFCVLVGVLNLNGVSSAI